MYGYNSRIKRSKSLRESSKCCTLARCCTDTLSKLCVNARIDDVEDGSSLRRGFPVAHSIYGVPQTINSANYVYFCALRELERLQTPKLFKIFYGTLRIMMV